MFELIIGAICRQNTFFICVADASMYAHYLFNAFDTTNNGSIKFKVRKQSIVITFNIEYFCDVMLSATKSFLVLNVLLSLEGFCDGVVYIAAGDSEGKTGVDVSSV